MDWRISIAAWGMIMQEYSLGTVGLGVVLASGHDMHKRRRTNSAHVVYTRMGLGSVRTLWCHDTRVYVFLRGNAVGEFQDSTVQAMISFLL
jgi:hypothetical protein